MMMAKGVFWVMIFSVEQIVGDADGMCRITDDEDVVARAVVATAYSARPLAC